MSYHLACYPNPNPNPYPNPNPNSNSNSNPNPNPNSNSNSNSSPNPNPNPKLGRLFNKICELYLFSTNKLNTKLKLRTKGHIQLNLSCIELYSTTGFQVILEKQYNLQPYCVEIPRLSYGVLFYHFYHLNEMERS